ncbi:Flp pilus assembly protein CpaB [Sphingomonas sp. SM33]|uniref:Flp pilus assembly protein CpaB n=1 Tax=Sphingomonas telluris TaxID=2907998 RepID=A0ABS9VJ87_9SPHN|nr:Flp pilus assembly protein CpaB [Sphingomonas telluris]MCH8614763.1 Flp pilus assembly protein CpaB [Sphingomonas telluris]
MRRQTVIALAVALVLGLLAVYLANIFLSANERKAQQATANMVKVAVAAVPLDYGVDISPDKVKFVDYPSTSIPAGSFNNYAQLAPEGKRRVVLRPMTVNEPILATKLAGEGLGPSIAYLLPDGMRAAAVRINDVSGVAGFIQPSDSVDVLITRNQSANGSTQATDVLLQNIRVIAIDQNAQGANGQPVLAKTATLEVSPTDAQKLALAQQVGALSLVLRKPGQEQDSGRVATVSMNDLRYSYYSGARVTPAAQTEPAPRVSVTTAPRRAIVRRPAPVAAPAQPRPISNSVEVVRGTQGSNYEVGGYGS